MNAANLLAARENVTDAQWDPGQRVKAREHCASCAVRLLTRLRAQIGGFLLRAVLETASVKVPGQVCSRPSHARFAVLIVPQEPGTFEIKPAFELTYVYDPRSERRHGAVKWHPRVGQILREADELRGSLHPRHAPMLVPPRPWTSVRTPPIAAPVSLLTAMLSLRARQFDKGGYHILDSLIMRGGYGPAGPSKAQLDALREEQRRGDMVSRMLSAHCRFALSHCATRTRPAGASSPSLRRSTCWAARSGASSLPCQPGLLELTLPFAPGASTRGCWRRWSGCGRRGGGLQTSPPSRLSRSLPRPPPAFRCTKRRACSCFATAASRW